MKKQLDFRSAGLALCLLFFLPAEAQRITGPVGRYTSDRASQAANYFTLEDDEFFDFFGVDNYADPDFTIALDLPSPLDDDRFDSYDLIVIVNKNDHPTEPGQTMRVYDRNLGGLVYFWKVSTARRGKMTPNGYFRVQSFSSNHRSSLYNNAAMPWSVFFNGNIATHGVFQPNIAQLGKPASAGCVRLEPQRARDLFHRVGRIGSGQVDDLDHRSGAPVTNFAGVRQQTWGYKTLFIVKSEFDY